MTLHEMVEHCVGDGPRAERPAPRFNPKLSRHSSPVSGFVSEQRRTSITSLTVEDLAFERVLTFLKYLEQQRGNSVRTRNQRRAALNTFYAYLRQLLGEQRTLPMVRCSAQ
ncbi:hypothetical protein [Paraburkholderia terricola]|uniref:hypothetical protein n=1 Tax=Paraburkholderia terricola TaxID=169427 RepID=UPI001FCA47F9|nr:hypothetical protein [Paraburkholderia terricola]